MKCPKCGGDIGPYLGTTGTALKKLAKGSTLTTVGGLIGSVGGGFGILIGALVGASIGARRSKKEKRYRECSSCGYIEWES